MKNKLENFLIELDNKLESAKDDRNTKIVNYIQLSQNAKEAFIMYLINDYQLNNRDYKKLNLRKYAYAPLAVAASSIGALYTIQHGISVFDLFGIMLETYFVGLVSTRFAAKKNNDYFTDVVRKELDDSNIKQKLDEFTKIYLDKNSEKVN